MSGVDREPLRVLHVDDEPDFAELAATFLEREREEFEVDTATSATEGLAFLAEADDTVDCIVSDYDMPGMDGLEFLETVREEHPKLPFVLFTGRGSEEIASEAITAGVTEYLNKGSGTDQYAVLAHRIDNAVSQYRAERELRTSTERIRKLYGGITDAIFVLDGDWQFTHLNDRAEEILERTEAELIGEDVWEQFPEAVDTTFQEKYEKAMDQQVPVEFEQFYPPLDVWVDIRAVPIDDGLTIHFRDISAKKEREQTIRRQKERLQTIVENAPVVLFTLDGDGVFTLSEGRGLAGLGLESGELVGQSAFDVYADTPIVEDVRRAIDGEAVQSTVGVGDRVFETWYQPVEDEEDTGDQVIGVAIDVTERAERERRFSAVFNNTFQFMALLQPDGTVIEINNTALQFSGNDRAEIVGRPFWELPPLELSEGTSGRVKDAVERAANGESVRFEEEIGTGDDLVTTDTSVKPVVNEHDNTEFIVAEGRDITRRRENEQRLDALTKAFPDLAFLVDEDGRYNEVLASPASEDLLAADPTEIVGNTVHDLFDSETADEFLSVVQRALETDQLQTLDYELDTPAGTQWFEARTIPLPTDVEGKRATVTATRDITERKEREQELEARATAMATSMDGMAILDADGEYTYVNEAHTDVYGHDDEDAFLGEHWEMCYDEEDVVVLEEEAMPALEHSGQWRGEATGKRRDGTRFSQELTLTALDDDGLVCVVRDISDQRKHERELERKTDLLERTQRIASVGGWELDLVDDELRWTDEVRRIHGVSQDYEPTLGAAIDFYHPEDAPVIENAIERAIEDGESFDTELRLTTASGDQRWVRAQGEPHDENGETVLLRGVFQDVTERKRTENELRDEQAFVDTALDALDDVFYFLDGSGKFVRWNDRLTDVTGYTDEEIAGMHATALVSEADHERVAAVISEVLETSQASLTAGLRTKSGETVPHEFRGVRLTDASGEIVGICGIARDITGHERNKRRLEALHEGTRAMMEATTHEEVCETAARTSKHVLGHSITVVRLLDADGETLVPVAQTDETRERVGERPAYPIGDTPAGRAYRGGTPRIYDDLAALDGDELAENYDPGNARSAMYVPLGEHGVVSIADTAADRFDRSDVALAKVLASNAEAALERADHERALEALHEGTRAMMNAETPEEVCDVAIETAHDALDLPLTGLWLYDPDDDCLRPTAFTDEGHALFEEFPTYTAGNSLSWEVFAAGEPAVYDDVGTRSATYNSDSPIASEIVVPLGDYGVLNSGSTDPEAFDDIDASAARILAANTEAALERAEHEAQVARERDRFSAIFENTRDPSVIVELHDGEPIVQSANAAFEGVFGYRSEQVVGRSLDDLIVPPDRALDPDDVDRGESLAREVRRLTADGELRDFLFRNVPIDESGEGESFGIYTDITERREAQEYRDRLYEIVADAGLAADERVNGLLALGSERLGVETGFLTHIADGTQRVVEARGPHEAIRPGSECPLPRTYCRETIESDGRMTLRHAAEEGWEDDPAYEEFGLETYVGSKVTVDGELYGTVCFADRSARASDFSTVELAFVDLLTRAVASELERRRYERELERQNDRLEEFASVLSHDLRNPLGVAQGYLELVSEEDDEQFLRKVRDAHDRMEQITEDVLALARQGRSIGETSTVDLAATAERAWENVETEEAELSIGTGRERDLGTVEADGSRLEQLFENLFRNAIEHGGEDVAVRIDRSDEGFFIADDGPGIPAEERDQVLEHGHTTSDSGTGFGLSIVEQIASAHDWGLAVAEGESGGARFEIRT